MTRPHAIVTINVARAIARPALAGVRGLRRMNLKNQPGWDGMETQFGTTFTKPPCRTTHTVRVSIAHSEPDEDLPRIRSKECYDNGTARPYVCGVDLGDRLARLRRHDACPRRLLQRDRRGRRDLAVGLPDQPAPVFEPRCLGLVLPHLGRHPALCRLCRLHGSWLGSIRRR